jgi:hypothetical protein
LLNHNLTSQGGLSHLLQGRSTRTCHMTSNVVAALPRYEICG